MRTKGAKSKHGNYYSIERLQTKAEKLRLELEKFMDATQTNRHVRVLIDFDKLTSASDHLKEISKLKITV